MLRHRGGRCRRSADRVAHALLIPLLDRPALRQVTVDRVVRGGLIRHRIRLDAAFVQGVQYIDDIAEQRHRNRLAADPGGIEQCQRFVQGFRLRIHIARLQPLIDAALAALDRQHAEPRHGGRERLRSAHAAEARGEYPLAVQFAAEVPPSHLDEGLVRPLHDALAADVDPRACRHLAVHGEALAVELVEMLPGRPVRHQIGIGDEHARRIGVGREHAHGLSDCTSKVSSSVNFFNVSTIRSKQFQSRAARPMPPYTTSSAGFSATSGSKLFISIRSGASVIQVRALKVLPRAARITRGFNGASMVASF